MRWMPHFHARAALIAFLLVAPVTVRGSEPPLSDFAITSWTKSESIRSLSVWSICQDQDGYLWLGTSSGLIRFDGVRFVPWEALGRGALPRDTPISLLSARDGSLWVGFNGAGIARIRRGEITFFRDPEGLTLTRTLLEDQRGQLWASSRGGLYRFTGSDWEHQGADTGLPLSPTNTLYEDEAGRLWVRTFQGSFRRESPDKRWERVTPRLDQSIAANQLAPARSASTQPGARRDRQGNVWIISLGQGLWRIRPGANDRSAVEHMTVQTGLSSDVVTALYEDREGNIWVGTQSGLHELTPRMVTPVRDIGTAVAAQSTPDGSTWLASNHGLIRFKNGRRITYTEREGLPGTNVRAIFAERDGTLWVAANAGFARFAKEHLSRLSMAAGRPLGRIMSIATDSEGTLWVADLHRGLFRLRDGHLTSVDDIPEVKQETALGLFTDDRGRVWMGFSGGRVGVLEAGHLSVHDRAGISGPIAAITEDPSGAIWIGGDNGVARFAGGRWTAATAQQNGFPSSQVTAIVADAEGSIWAGTKIGLVRVEPAEIDRVASSPAYKIQYKLYDETDGLEGLPIGLANPGGVRAADGSLWFVTNGGATIVTPKTLSRSHVPPPVRIEEIRAGSERFEPAASPTLPPHNQRLEIDYTALSLTSPQSVRFRFRLDGFDTDWQDAGARRQAIYTNLPPGHYRFRVLAFGKEGASDPAGATVAFAVAPAFYQTTLFYAGCLAALAALATTAWRLRLKQLRNRFSSVIAERARISREVHDTLLQSLVAVALQSGTIAEQAQGIGAQGIREQLIRMRKEVEEQIREVRQTIWNLRSPMLERRGLAAALRETGERIARQASARFDFNLAGQPRPCAPVLEEQLLRIGQEALINAGRHARASKIRVQLTYEEDRVELRVSDDGIGFDTDVDVQTSTHFGLTNMRERAQQAGGLLTVRTAGGKGTEIVATVPLYAGAAV